MPEGTEARHVAHTGWNLIVGQFQLITLWI